MGNLRMAVKLGAVVAVAGLAATACSSGGGSSTTTSAGSTRGFNAALNSVVNPSDKAGGTLKMAISDDVDSLDPARTYYAFSWNLQRYFSRTLLTFDTKPGKNGTTLVADLAQSVPTSSDGQSWTYKLRSGLKMQDGTPITSKFVKYAIERVFAEDVISGGPTYVVCLLDTCDDSGAPTTYKGPYKDTSPDKLGLKTVVTPDDQTITFNLVKPFSDWNYLMALPTSAPVNPAMDTGDKYAQNPQASGPYQIDQYNSGKILSFKRNPNWDKSTDPVRKALPDAINIQQGVTPDQQDAMLLAGQIDVEPEGVGVQVKAQNQVMADPNLKAYADNPNTGFTRYLFVSTQVPPLTNVDCRKAVQFALDKNSILLAMGGSLNGTITAQMLPPLFEGRGYIKFNNFSQDPGGDLTQAKAELAKCGQPNGFSTKIAATSDRPKTLAVAQAAQAALAKVGIKIDVVTHASKGYYSSFIGVPNTLHTQGIGLGVAGWGADYPTPYGFFKIIVDGRSILAQGNSNYAELNDPKINGLIDQATKTTDQAKLADIWHQVDVAVSDSGAYAPYTSDKAVFYHTSRLANVYFTNAFGMYDYVNLGVGGG